MEIAISILGATGKMGQRIIQLAKDNSRYRIISGTQRSRPSAESHRTTPCGIPLTTSPQEAMAHCQVALDFSSMDAAKQHIEAACALKKGLVMGTTGLDRTAFDAMQSASEQIPILYSPNFSLGIALCIDTVKRLGSVLFGQSEIDIIESHHLHKKDSPSGTALALAAAVGAGEITLPPIPAHRKKEQIVIHSIRSGHTIGEHTILFECGDERIQISHQAHNRDAFAKGALLAAEFIVRQPPGLYSLQDLFRD